MTKPVAVALAWIVMVVVCGRAASAQSPTEPGAGHWEGTVSVQGKDLRVEIDLAKTADKWEGALAFPEMNAKGLALAPITVEGETVTFALKGMPGDPTFKGTLSKDSRTLSGDFTQGPVSGTFTLAWKGEAKLEAPPKNAPVGKEFEGAWEGALDVNGKTLRLNVQLTNQESGATGTMVSVDQGGVEIALGSIVQTDAHLKFTVPGVGGTYEGDLKDGLIAGTWAQGPGTLPLVFKRAVK